MRFGKQITMRCLLFVLFSQSLNEKAMDKTSGHPHVLTFKLMPENSQFKT